MNEELRRRLECGFGLEASVSEEVLTERDSDLLEFVRLTAGGRQSGWPKGTLGPKVSSVLGLVALLAMVLIVEDLMRLKCEDINVWC